MQAVAAMEAKRDFKMPQAPQIRQQKPAKARQDKQSEPEPAQAQPQVQRQRSGMFTGSRPLYKAPEAPVSGAQALAATEESPADSPDIDAAINPFASPSSEERPLEDASNPFITSPPLPPPVAAPPATSSGRTTPPSNKSVSILGCSPLRAAAACHPDDFAVRPRVWAYSQFAVHSSKPGTLVMHSQKSS